jgi:nicotinamidase-related amidase
MEIVAGKELLTTTAELLDPRWSALIVVDVQNDFCSRGGVWVDESSDYGWITQALTGIGRLIDAAHHANVRVIYVQMLIPPDLSSMSPAYLRFMTGKYNLVPDRLGCEPGTWGADIVAELAPRPDDLVISKWRSSAFVGTNLDLVLRAGGIRSAVVCGTATYACVESTIRDAFNNDYYVIEVEDAVMASDRQLHEASLSVMRSRIEVVTCDEVCQVWVETGTQTRLSESSVKQNTEDTQSRTATKPDAVIAQASAGQVVTADRTHHGTRIMRNSG